MTHINVDELDANLAVLLEYADQFFAGTVTQEQLFQLIRISFGDLSKLFDGLNARGALTVEDVGRYQWAATVIPAILLTLERDPKYGTDALERQLKGNFRTVLKRSQLKTVQPAAEQPLAIMAPRNDS